MKKNMRRGVLAVLAVVLVVCLAVLVLRLRDYRQGREIYAEAEELSGLPDLSQLPLPTPAAVPEPTPAPAAETTAPAPAAPVETPDPEPTPTPTPYVDPYADALAAMDFTALREVNGDVLGWILIPGTTISYPLLRGEDNEYYLDHTWKRTSSSVGAIFLECQCAADLWDFNTIIYGHRMQDRSMFGPLGNYKSRDFWAGHPCVYLTDDNGTHRYDIFAAYESSTEGPAYRIGLFSEKGKQAFLDECMAQSVIDTGIVPTTADRILTLSTCTNTGNATRWVVQAVSVSG